MSQWIGYAVSVNCGEPLGCYQGTICETDGNTMTLTKAFRNGFPYPKSQVTLNAADIKDLQIIEESFTEPSKRIHSTLAVTKSHKKGQRATVCENLQANPSSSAGEQQSCQIANTTQAPRGVAVRTTPQQPTRSKPIDIQGPKNKNSYNSGSYGNSGSAGKARAGGGCVGPQEKARRRNEACFGDAADPALDDDFDFEGNLALFDKQALWEEMRAAAARPDVVRAADEAGAGVLRLRHDENVLCAPAAPLRAIRLPDALAGPRRYVTDEGVVVPSAAPALRRRLWAGLRRLGLMECATTLLARAAADVALRLLGGARRLDPRNAHQPPCVAALCAPHRAGAAGVLAARLLASHGVRTAVLLPGGAQGAAAGGCGALQRELAALALGGESPLSSLSDLPSADLVLLALYDPQLDDPQEPYEEALAWARGARGPLVALEPPAAGWGAGLTARAAVQAVLPAALPDELGQLYLADVAPPPRLFHDLHLAYRSPFGAAAVLPLHPAPTHHH